MSDRIFALSVVLNQEYKDEDCQQINEVYWQTTCEMTIEHLKTTGIDFKKLLTDNSINKD